MKEVTDIIFHDNGNTMAFDIQGNQIPERQMSWLKLYALWLQEQGADPFQVTFILPGFKRARLIPQGRDFNWEINP